MKRQGDLLIVKVKGIPEDVVKQKNRVLAEGEITGHMHELDSGEVYEKNGTLYFEVAKNQTSVLKHQEHGVLNFEPGTYKVIRQREYEPNNWKRSRKVYD